MTILPAFEYPRRASLRNTLDWESSIETGTGDASANWSGGLRGEIEILRTIEPWTTPVQE